MARKGRAGSIPAPGTDIIKNFTETAVFDLGFKAKGLRTQTPVIAWHLCEEHLGFSTLRTKDDHPVKGICAGSFFLPIELLSFLLFLSRSTIPFQNFYSFRLSLYTGAKDAV